jgi:hypothetical protein
MKTIRILFLSLILLGVTAGTGFAATSLSAGIRVGPSGHSSVDVGFFYDDLAGYGNWVQRPNYGWAWRPHHRSHSWRPYQAGHWVLTDEGWTWMSDEPYGWATYHYGRWYDDPNYGWEWIPGNQWAPAWVAWQEGGNYVGWAPLPPSVDFRTGIDLNVSLGSDAYLFVPERQFLAPRLSGYFVPRAEAARIFPTTRNITRYNLVNDRVFNQGVPVDRFQRTIGRSVPRYQIADLSGNQRHQGARVAQNRVAFFRPQVDKAQVAPPPNRPIARHAVIAGAAVGAVAIAAVAAHHANQGRAAGNVPPAAAREQAKAERRQIAQAPPNHKMKQPDRGARVVQPVPEAKKPPVVQQQAAQQQKNQQRQAAQQKGNEQKAQRQEAQQQQSQQRQVQKQAAQQKGEEQKAQRQAAQQQQGQQRQAQRQAPQQQQGQQRQAQRQAPPPQQQGQQRQAQRQAPPPQPKNQGKPPGKPHDEKQKPPQQ